MLLPNKQHVRRPRTLARTGRRERLLVASSPTRSAVSSVTPSSQLTRICHESGGNLVAALNRLLNTLKENKVPGPQLFRLKEEFSAPLGEGGQGNVRGINKKSAQRYLKADKSILTKWPVELIAIKQHQRSKAVEQTQNTGSYAREVDPSKDDLGNRFRAAECEVLALSPSLFRGHPNIVQLVGWGLCLDTIENPESPCCGSLQTPLLVLERAEMNLSQFLQHLLFPVRMRTQEVRAEEGSVGESLGGPYMSPQLKWTEMLSSGWSILAESTGFVMDPFEIVRLLCVDIGHGLQSLHEHKFTHGDLKPENVLIFKTSRQWLAKLCDFGCARGQAENEAGPGGQPQKERYLGTDSWLPPWNETTREHDYDGLRTCDLYVYGLVVWSSFCLRGNSPPQNPKLEDAQANLQQLARQRRWLPFPSNKKWLADRINRVLSRTMTDRHSRHPTPWEYLLSDNERKAQTKKSARTMDTPSGAQDASGIYPILSSAFSRCRSARETSTIEPKVRPPLSPTVKAKYNEKAWWSRTTAVDAPLTAQGTRPTTDNDLDSTSSSAEPLQLALSTTASHYSTQEEGFGPASSIVLSPDDDSLSTTLFQGDRRREDAERLFQDITDTLTSWRAASNSSEDLYYYARFRSRIRLEWWGRDPRTENILSRALKIVPAVEICTLAWLCKGPVGKSEVENLPANDETWRVVLDPNFLNESERLDRFLLLLQFGARVEEKAPIRRQFRSWAIFTGYIQTCRPATIPTVMEKIYRRSPVKMSRVMRHLRSDAHIETHQLREHGIAEGQNPDETTSLLPLPLGWKAFGKPGPAVQTTCFEETFTQSITLTSPKFSIMKTRQVKIGFLDQGEGHVCHLDLVSCLRSGTSMVNKTTFDEDMTTRFPSYNDDWFAAEWTTQPSQKDMLASLSEPWRLPTFTMRLLIPQRNMLEVVLLRMVAALVMAGLVSTIVVVVVGLVVCHGLSLTCLSLVPQHVT